MKKMKTLPLGGCILLTSSTVWKIKYKPTRFPPVLRAKITFFI